MLMQRTHMVWPGARIGIAASGGSDSFVLAQTMLIRQAIMPFPVEFMVLHVNAGFDMKDHRPLEQWVERNGLAGHFEVSDHGPKAHSDANTSGSPCFLCSWSRRKRLFSLCDRYNLTHLALGHNSDDLLSTFFMNLLRTGRVESMSPSEQFFSGKLRLIRPLLFVEKKYINSAARQWGLPVWQNPCPSANSSGSGPNCRKGPETDGRGRKDAKQCLERRTTLYP